MICKNCGKEFDYGKRYRGGKYCLKCVKRPKNNKKLNRKKSLNIVGKKKVKRLKEGGSEVKLYKEIWEEREHKCCICGHYILKPNSYVFAHILAKGMYPKYRLNKNNIGLVCSIECHNNLDKYINKIGKKVIEEKIKQGGENSFSKVMMKKLNSDENDNNGGVYINNGEFRYLLKQIIK